MVYDTTINFKATANESNIANICWLMLLPLHYNLYKNRAPINASAGHETL